MALNDLQIESVVSENPPTKKPDGFQTGTKYSDYLDLLLAKLSKKFPSEQGYLQTRKDDAQRRLGVVIKKKYPHYKSDKDKAHYVAKIRKAVTFEKLPEHLKQSYSIKEQPAKRREIAGVMGIVDKGHATHGANFTSPQTMKQIIDNLFGTISAPQQAAIATRIMTAYGYDPR